jgi:hypothetical protein
MTHSDYNFFDETAPLIFKAQQNLLKPKEFYLACQKLQTQSPQNLYFTILDRELNLPSRLRLKYTFRFFDYLAQQLRYSPLFNPQKWQVIKIKIKLKNKIITSILVARNYQSSSQTKSHQCFKIALTPVGEGAIGRVIKIRINRGETWAFKTFFDPQFVWQHGPWAEIPLGIWFTAQKVTKDLPIFKFAGCAWAVWEWIDDDISPQSRSGLTYAQFAQKHQLTPLNPLNRSNYNAHNIRLDLGGIQRNNWGRRWYNIERGTCFYYRQFRQKGFRFLQPYWSLERWRYLSKRLLHEWGFMARGGTKRKQSRRMF